MNNKFLKLLGLLPALLLCVALIGCEDSVDENLNEAADDREDMIDDLEDGDVDAAREDAREMNEDLGDANDAAREALND